ncbi:MAG: Sapep family Mn(2+)-dependent dipeptidase [Clostridiales bacterium]|nr:Sapep family Mn(2+)-dependent dipeptidase [Clostridiales bacterium]MBP5416179.1 Sapep family Mn(2+)-dependent dipeptidase [Clostridiales bacterium]
MNHLSEQEKATFNTILSDLIAIPSVKGEPSEGAPYGVHPKAALTYFLSRAAEDGFIAENIGDKAGYVQWGTKGPLLAVLGHLDVVPEGSDWKTEAFHLTSDDTSFYGRGVVDDKGPVVSAYMALLRFKENHPDPDYRVRLIVGTDEEHGSSCMERYCETEELPDIGFTPDAEFPCIFAEKGIYQMHFEAEPNGIFTLHGGNAANMVPPYCECIDLKESRGISTKGVQAHASHPDLGINAIDLMLDKMDPSLISASPLLQLMKKYFSKESATPFSSFFGSDISGSMTTNVGIVDISKDHARLHVDIRFPVTLSEEAVRSKLLEAASEFGVKVVDDSVQPPLFKDKESRQISVLTEIFNSYREQFSYSPDEADSRASALKEESAPIAIGGGTYARTMPNIVAFGPQLSWGKDQCHQANESILKENLYLLVPMYEEALEKLGNIIIG